MFCFWSDFARIFARAGRSWGGAFLPVCNLSLSRADLNVPWEGHSDILRLTGYSESALGQGCSDLALLNRSILHVSLGRAILNKPLSKAIPNMPLSRAVLNVLVIDAVPNMPLAKVMMHLNIRQAIHQVINQCIRPTLNQSAQRSFS